MNYAKMFTAEAVNELFKIWASGEFYAGIWATLYTTLLATFFALVIGLPLGVLLVAGREDGVLPLPKPVMAVLNALINILLMGTSVGTKGTIVPLVVAAFPFMARLIESSLREVDAGMIEAAQSMGATPFQIIWKVMIPESIPSLAGQVTTALTTILGYGAMAGAIGGDGLGKIAISYGYNRYKPLIMLVAVVLLVVIVNIIQTVGSTIAVHSDKRLRK